MKTTATTTRATTPRSLYLSHPPGSLGTPSGFGGIGQSWKSLGRGETMADYPDDFILSEDTPEPPKRETWEDYEHLLGRPRPDSFSTVVEQGARMETGRYWVDPPPRGDSAKLATSVDVATAQLVNVLIASQQFPWRLQADFVRSAIYFFLMDHMPGNWTKKYSEDLQILRAAQGRAVITRRNNSVSAVVKDVREAVVSYLAVQQKENAVHYLCKEVEVLGNEKAGDLGVMTLDLLRRTLEQGEELKEVWDEAHALGMQPRLGKGGGEHG